MKFTDFSKEMQEVMCTVPQSVFVTKNPDDETDAQVIARQEKFLKLPENIKDKLVAQETANKIKAIGAHYNLGLLQMAPIARIVRNYYFGEVKAEDFPSIIENESGIPYADAENVSKYLMDRIIGKNISVGKVIVKTEKKTLNNAMEVYPNIKNQKITNYSIEVEGEKMSPTIENWIKDYYNVVGAGNRDIVKRSSYLYHSKNVKVLSSVERQKLSVILKSLDEGTLIGVIPEKKEIYFDIAKDQPKPQAVNFDVNKENEKVSKNDFETGQNNRDLLKKDIADSSQDSEVLLDEKKEVINKDNLKHTHGNNWDLGSAHFKDNKKKRSIFSFFSKNKDESSDVKFSFSQQFPVEKEKTGEIIEGNKTNSTSNKRDFFGKIEPLEK